MPRCFVFSLSILGKLLLLSNLAFQPACAILTKPLIFPSNINNGGGGGRQQQVVGIITGPYPSSSDWSPSSTSSFNWSYYLNSECQSDNDCYPSRTLLYCISYRCQCITAGATYLNGLFYNYNMEWSESTSLCKSQVGSPCTLKQYWYSSDIVKMDCVQGHECTDVTSPAAKATIATQNALAYGSAVSVNQQLHQTPPLSYYQHLQYFGSGVVGLTNNHNKNDAVTGQRQMVQPQPSSAVAASATTDPKINSWGICVRKLNNDVISTSTGELSVNVGSSTGFVSVRGSGLSLIMACFTLSLSVLLMRCAT